MESDWSKVHLGDLVTFSSGGTPNKSNPLFWNGSIPWISAKTMKSLHISSSSLFITPEGLSNGSKLAPKDSLLLLTRGSGLFNGIPICYVDSPVAYNQDIKCIRCHDTITTQFVFFWLRAQSAYLQAKLDVTGIGAGKFDTDFLRNLEVELPPIDTQKKIISILSALDEKIAVNERINANLQEQAQMLFDNWLADASSMISIGEIADNILDYSTCSQKKVVLVNSSDVTEGHFEHHTLSDNNELKGHFKKRFHKWDILYSEIRPRNHHYAYCQFDPHNYIASTRLMVVRAKSQMVYSSVLYQYLMLNQVFEEFTLKTETRSGTFPQGKYEDMAMIRIPYRSIDEQKNISCVLDNIHAEIWNNEQENHKLAEARDTLLPKLMSGELDVSSVTIPE